MADRGSLENCCTCKRTVGSNPTLSAMRRLAFFAVLLAVTACGASSGVVPVAPGTYVVSEMRAQAIGGGPRAQAAVLAEADGFCRAQGLGVALLDLQPGGDPRGYYWPTAFTATFRCVAPARGQPRAGPSNLPP